MEADLRWKSISFSLKGTAAPLLSIIGFDTLESIYGPNVMDHFTDHLASVKRNKAVLVGFIIPLEPVKGQTGGPGDPSHPVGPDRGTTVVYSIEPFTECNALVVDRRWQTSRRSPWCRSSDRKVKALERNSVLTTLDMFIFV